MLEKLARKLVARRTEMERDIFDSPPEDWAGFQKRLGQYEELAGLLTDINAVMAGDESDE